MSDAHAATGGFSSPSPLAASTPEDHIEIRGRLTVEDLVRHTWYRRTHDQVVITVLLAVFVFALPILLWYNDPGIPFLWAVAIGALGVAASLWINHWQFTRFAKRIVRQMEPLGEVVVRLSAKGIEQKTQASTGVTAWSAVNKIMRSKHAIYVDLGGVTHVFPRRFFPDADLGRVEARLVGWWRPGRMPPKPF